MSYTTEYTLISFDAVAVRLTVEVRVLWAGVVQETKTITVPMPVNSQGNTTTDMNQIDLLVRTAITRRVQYLEQRVPPGGIVNAPAIYALTSSSEPMVEGYVLDQLGAPVVGATIRVSNQTKTALTDAVGYYAIACPVGTVVITAVKLGSLDTFKSITVAGETRVDLVLRSAEGLSQVYALTAASTNASQVVNTGRLFDQAQVLFPAGSIVDANGDPVNIASVQIANTVVSDTGFTEGFPGYFMGQTGPASPEPIQSFGYIDVNITDENGLVLELDPSKPATVKIPVYPDPVGLDVMPIWKLNTTTGIWVYSTDATRVGSTNVFEFEATSFSTYNCDKPFTTTKTLVVKAYNDPTYSGGTPVFPAAGVEVTVDILPSPLAVSAWQGRGVTNSSGELTLTVPPGFLRVVGKKGTRTYNSYSYDIDSITGNATTNLLYTVTEPLPAPDPSGTVTVVYNDTVIGSTTTFDVVNASALSVGMEYQGDFGQEVGTFTITDITGNTLTIFPESYLDMLAPASNMKFYSPPPTVGVDLDTATYGASTTSITVDDATGLSANWRLVSVDGNPPYPEISSYASLGIIESVVGTTITFKGTGIILDNLTSPTGTTLYFREPYPWI